MQKKFLEYLEKECGASAEAGFLVAVSGGIDSSVMAYLFSISGIRFSIAHCNFSLRGEESDGDQKFVEDLASSFGVKCFLKKFDTKEYALNKGQSVQVAARELRYEWFREIAAAGGLDYIAVGHNSDDVIETFLINLSRGTGIRGLTGIKPKNGNIIRPLLFASRKDIMQFAMQNNISWRNDSSNASLKYHRNAIRNIIIPQFENIYPAFRSNIISGISNLRQAEELYNESVNHYKKSITEIKDGRLLINIEKLLNTGFKETILFEILKDYGCNQSMSHTISDTTSKISGRQVFTKTHVVTRDRNYLIVSEKPLQVTDEQMIDVTTDRIFSPFEMSFSIKGGDEPYTTDNNIASLDLGLLEFPLRLRKWKEGDRFSPLGMKGTKKISDYLINHKIPRPDKHDIWVLESGSHIAWLVGHRIDDRFKVTSSTKKIFVAEKL